MPSTILKPQFLIAKKQLKAELPGRSVIRNFGLLFFASSTMLLVYLGTEILLRRIQGDPFISVLLPIRLVQMSFYLLFLLLVISATISAIGNIFTSDKMDLLLRAPISNLRLFLSKIAVICTEAGMMYVLLLVPISLAYYVKLDLGLPFLLAAAIVSIPLILIAAAIGSILATAIVSFLGFFWRRGFMFAFVSIGVISWLLIKADTALRNIEFRAGKLEGIIELVGPLTSQSPVWMPSFWAADVITGYVDPLHQSTYADFGLLYSTMIGLLAVAYLAFDFFMLSVRSRSQGEHRIDTESKLHVSSKDIVRQILEFIYYKFPINPSTRALILKDLTTLIRDRSQGIQLLLYLGFASFLLIVIRFMNTAVTLIPVGHQAWLGFVSIVNILFCSFIVVGATTRLVYPSISLEGRSFWILLVAPFNLKNLIKVKFYCWLPIVTLLTFTLIMVGASTLDTYFSTLAYTGLVAIGLSIGFTGIAIGLGAVFATFEWESPNQIATGLGAVAVLPTGLTVVALTLIPGAICIFLCQIPMLQNFVGFENAYLALTFLGPTIIGLPLLTTSYLRQLGARSLAKQLSTNEG